MTEKRAGHCTDKYSSTQAMLGGKLATKKSQNSYSQNNDKISQKNSLYVGKYKISEKVILKTMSSINQLCILL